MSVSYFQPMMEGSRPWIDVLSFSVIPGHNRNSLRHIWSKIDVKESDQCWPWTGARVTVAGSLWHGRISFGCKLQLAHRLIWASIHGFIPTGIVIRHSCDNPACCNPAHLLAGTQFDNIRDCVDRGRKHIARGIEHSNAKLSEDDVVEIRLRLRDGEGVRHLAREYGLCHGTVSNIKTGKKWRHLLPLSEAA